jgi:hypothetical protein
VCFDFTSKANSRKYWIILAEVAFKAIGNQLKKLRIDDDLEVMLSYLPAEQGEVKDPAEEVKRML